jgi:glucosamine--fructose-6-phosphate aminotransferase (isomerizing)
MCGIVAYLGEKKAQPILIEGLKRLEYRGYDSAGIALLERGKFEVIKTRGRIQELERILPAAQEQQTIGMGQNSDCAQRDNRELCHAQKMAGGSGGAFPL